MLSKEGVFIFIFLGFLLSIRKWFNINGVIKSTLFDYIK